MYRLFKRKRAKTIAQDTSTATSLAESITIPPTSKHTHTVVFLHGRGDTALNFAASLRRSTDSQGRTLQQIFPSFRWVFPQAELRTTVALPGNPRTSQWFDIRNARDFSQDEQLQTVGLRESVTAIRDILRDQVAQLDGRWDRIVLAGISQGGATSVHTLLNLKLDPATLGDEQHARYHHHHHDEEEKRERSRRLGALLGFSCWMPFPGRSLNETRQVLGLAEMPGGNGNGDDDGEGAKAFRNTPALLEHCVDDPVVSIEHGRVLLDTLRAFGARVTMHEYPLGKHWINSPAGVDDVVRFLNAYVFD